MFSRKDHIDITGTIYVISRGNSSYYWEISTYIIKENRYYERENIITAHKHNIVGKLYL